MVRGPLLFVLLATVTACKSDPPPPPATGRQAPRGLPPADPADLAKAPPPPPSQPSLPANHPPVADQPANHPPIGEEPPGHGDTAANEDVPPGSPELSGEIAVDPKLAADVKLGDTVYVFARSVNASGQVERSALVAARIEVGDRLPMAFRMTANNVMAAGAEFAGEVEITARLDRDREVMSRAPGDIEGKVRAKIPSKDVKIVLDTKVTP